MYLSNFRTTRMVLVLLIGATSQFCLDSRAVAEIIYSPDKCLIAIRGEITQTTASEIETHLSTNSSLCRQGRMFPLNTPAGDKDALTRQSIHVQLNSSGGDVEAAIRIGTAIRNVAGTTIVPADSACASACVLIILGGIDRHVAGKVGLHRAYLMRLAGSPTDARKSYDAINSGIANYLKTMNISERLLDVMNSVPPNDMRWLSIPKDEETLRELRISGTDPIYGDQRDSFMASKLGITKTEYYNRQRTADVACNKANSTDSIKAAEAYINCYRTIVHGDR